MKDLLREQQGMTLLDTLLAVAIVVLVVTATLTMVLTGERSSNQLLQWGDRTQQLRAAMNQIASDATYGEWDDTPVSGSGFVIRSYAPVVDWDKDNDATEDWTEADWPGYLKDQPLLYVRYTLQGDALVREVLDASFVPSSRQVLATGLIPSSDSNGSQLETDSSNHLAKVRLTTRGPGVKRVVEISSVFYLRF